MIALEFDVNRKVIKRGEIFPGLHAMGTFKHKVTLVTIVIAMETRIPLFSVMPVSIF